jgi:thioredoxin 1
MANALLTELNEATFDAATARGVTLVDFWAPWCGPCRMQAPVLEQLADVWEDKARIAKVNVDENPHLAARFRVNSIPLLLLLKDGQEIRRVVGLQSGQGLNELIASAL